MSGKTQIEKTALVDLRTFRDSRGCLSVVEEHVDIGFSFRRIYYLHSAVPGTERGAHAHRQLKQLCIAMAGRVEIDTDDGVKRQTYALETPEVGLLITPIVWRDVRQHKDSVLVVLASDVFDEGDYIWDYDEFNKLVR